MDTSQSVTLRERIATGWKKFRSFDLNKNLWKLVDWHRPWYRQVFAIIGFSIMFYFMYGGNVNMAIGTLIGMYLHEQGHAMVFRIAKVRCFTLFIFPIGAAAGPYDEKEKVKADALPWNTVAWLLHMGPLVNVLLLIIGHVAQQMTSGAWAVFFGDFKTINALLAITNLLPVSKFDAGQLRKLFYSSLRENHEWIVNGIITVMAAIFFGALIWAPGLADWRYYVLNILKNFGWLLFIIVFVAGIWHGQNLDKPEHADSKQAMSGLQMGVHFFVYMAITCTALWFTAGPLF